MNRYWKSFLINIMIITFAILLLFFVEFGHYAYLAGNLIIAGSAFIHLWLKDAKLYNRLLKLFVYMIIISIFFTFTGESAALKWNIWGYNPNRTMGIFIGPAFESISFLILVFMTIGGSVLRLCNQIDRKRDMSI